MKVRAISFGRKRSVVSGSSGCLSPLVICRPTVYGAATSRCSRRHLGHGIDAQLPTVAKNDTLGCNVVGICGQVDVSQPALSRHG